MSATSAEYSEILGGEVFVDISKLAEYARHGIPHDVRGQVWMYLLGVLPADRSKEISVIREKDEDYLQLDKENYDISKNLRGEISRYERRFIMQQPNPHTNFNGISRSRNIPNSSSHLVPPFSSSNYIQYRSSRYSSNIDSMGMNGTTTTNSDSSNSPTNVSFVPTSSPKVSSDTSLPVLTESQMSRISVTNGRGTAIVQQSTGEPNTVSNVIVHPLFQDDYTGFEMGVEDDGPTSMLSQATLLDRKPVNSLTSSGKKRFHTICENVIGAFINVHRDIEYSPTHISMCAPFIYCLSRESQIFYCFERLLEMIEDNNLAISLNEQVASFITLFRTALPDLYSYFEEEEVKVQELAASWLQFLFSREMRLDDIVRLWDTYFAVQQEMFDLHRFVCLSVLKSLKEVLEEMEQSEIRTILMRLPALDVDRIINDAFNLRHEHAEREYLDECEHRQEQQRRQHEDHQEREQNQQERKRRSITFQIESRSH